MRLLLVEDDDAVAEALNEGLMLHDQSYRIHRASRLAEAEQLVQTEIFDAALIDLALPDADGCEVANALREASPSLPLVAMTGKDFNSVALELTRIGVQDYLQKGTVSIQRVHQVLLLAMARHLKQLDLQNRAASDPLTGAMNRGETERQLEKAIDHARRTGLKTAALLLDVDDFKSVNDLHGHTAGDELLTFLVEEIASAIRTGDSIGRVGGDEFVLILEGIDNSLDAASAAHRVLALLEKPFSATYATSISVSIGIAIFPDHGDSAQELLERADEAMYRAKHLGKKTFAFYSPANSSPQLTSRRF